MLGIVLKKNYYCRLTKKRKDMIRKIIPVIIVALITVSCGSRTGKEQAAESGAIKVEFASLAANPSDYIDKDVVVEGKVVHVCAHTGKKMFIVGEDPDTRLFISAGENMPKFPMELLGSTVSVEGHIEQVVTADKPAEKPMVASLEEAAAPASDSAKAGPECETEAAVAKQTSLGNLMMVYNKHEVVK